MGFVETVERDLHGMDQTERDRLENSAAGQAGNNVGMVAGIFLPGPGGKAQLAAKLGTSIKNLKHIAKHLPQFQALKSKATLEGVVRLGRRIASDANNLVGTPGGRQVFEKTVNIGGQQVPVRVVVSPSGRIRSVHIRE